ncbi:hypothetical protein IWQ57_003618 [Coemansia nantahalensis]|uniref:Uncharacterized protein n=1 Tax=Coemansia nantahalensis TaxID=2789366 RepID=A0ACC1JVR2_9FUNG|nr:hypothetical protein IWQ57_003618 [Coemansia nantahalensis]
MIRRALGVAWRTSAPAASHHTRRPVVPGWRLLSDGRSRPDRRDSEDLHEWDRSVTEAIEQAKRELAAQKASEEAQEEENKKKGAAQRAPDGDPSPPAAGGKNKGTERDDYIVTLGRVMLELPEQIEGFFERGLDGAIYAESVRFAEPLHSGAHIAGKSQYLGAARVLRLAMVAYFSQPRVTILRLRQVRAPLEPSHAGSDGAGTDVLVRWVFEGVPRHTEILGGHGSRFEGEFRYAIDPRSGLVAEHEVTAIHPTPPTSFIASGLARWMGWTAPRESLSLSRQR